MVSSYLFLKLRIHDTPIVVQSSHVTLAVGVDFLHL